jgi:hypothetical protein
VTSGHGEFGTTSVSEVREAVIQHRRQAEYLAELDDTLMIFNNFAIKT